jgi:hypothetical protein
MNLNEDERVQLFDVQQPKTLVEATPVEFQFVDIKYNVKEKEILKGISGYLPPRKMLAIMVRIYHDLVCIHIAGSFGSRQN